MDVPPISPVIFYRDPRAALGFLERAFGFETRMMVDDGQGGIDALCGRARAATGRDIETSL